MAFLNNIFTQPKRVIALLLAVASLNLLIFASLFGFHENNDTEGYILSITFFRGQNEEIWPNRYLNPFYPVVAGNVFSFLPPATALITVNIIFYFALVLLTYGLVRRVFASSTVGFLATITMITAYPMLRYALTQVQDIGGYTWYVATLYAGWRWYESKHRSWLWLAGVAVAFGVLTKESGCMGSLFVGALLVLARRPLTTTIRDFLAVALPGVLTIAVNAVRGKDVAYNSARWFIDNWHIYAPTNYHFIKWLGVNLTTYNVTWVACGVGLFYILRRWSATPVAMKHFLLAMIVPSLTYFMWPLFISRTVFISAWLVLPLASYGVVMLAQQSLWWRRLAIALGVCMVVFPFVLQSTLRYAHVFEIMENCHKNIACSWNYFWQHRTSFSTEK